MDKNPDQNCQNSRPCQLAGTWYSADPGELRTNIELFLEQAGESSSENSGASLKALIVPHAGYRYSGATAAYAYQALKNRQYKRVFILAPSHHVHFEGAALSNYRFFATPLGEVEIEVGAFYDLINRKGFATRDKAHDPEHAIEIQLPFLQVLLPHLKIVPILISQLNPSITGSIVNALKPYFIRENLFVISSDFTHYGRSFSYTPFVQNIRQNIEKLDREAIFAIENKNPVGFTEFLQRTEATICGQNPISILLNCLERTDDVRLVHYTNSGTLIGDFSSSVSYAALTVCESSCEQKN
jgi:AmmeMemoRadiSam system protein B